MTRSRLRRLLRGVLRQASTPAGSPPLAPAPTVPESDAEHDAEYAPEYAPGYAPEPDGLPDPGEVVWAWVPYDDDPAQGKDRPVLVIGRDGATLLGLHLSSQDHDLDAADEARWGRHWMDVGSGGWDREGRPSEVRLDRLLRLEESAVRREGAALDRARFDAVVDAASAFHTF